MAKLSKEPDLPLCISRPGQSNFWPLGFRFLLTEQDSERYQYIFTTCWSRVFAALRLWTGQVCTSHMLLQCMGPFQREFGGFADHCSKSRERQFHSSRENSVTDVTQWALLLLFFILIIFLFFSANGSRMSVLLLNSEEIFPFCLACVEHLIWGNESESPLSKPGKQKEK